MGIYHDENTWTRWPNRRWSDTDDVRRSRRLTEPGAAPVWRPQISSCRDNVSFFFFYQPTNPPTNPPKTQPFDVFIPLLSTAAPVRGISGSLGRRAGGPSDSPEQTSKQATQGRHRHGYGQAHNQNPGGMRGRPAPAPLPPSRHSFGSGGAATAPFSTT